MASTRSTRTDLLALSDERDTWLRRVLDAERRGYDRGFRDGLSAYRDYVHGVVRDWTACVTRWDGTREHFADPRPGDYPGGPAQLATAVVWLGGPVVHRHACKSACYAYTPGPYLPSDAIGILSTLPDDNGEYAKTIAEMSTDAQRGAVAPTRKRGTA